MERFPSVSERASGRRRRRGGAPDFFDGARSLARSLAVKFICLASSFFPVAHHCIHASRGLFSEAGVIENIDDVMCEPAFIFSQGRSVPPRRRFLVHGHLLNRYSDF